MAGEKHEVTPGEAAPNKTLRLLAESKRLLKRVRENSLIRGRLLRRTKVLIAESQVRIDRADREAAAALR